AGAVPRRPPRARADVAAGRKPDRPADRRPRSLLRVAAHPATRPARRALRRGPPRLARKARFSRASSWVFSLLRGVRRIANDWIRPAARVVPGRSLFPRLGQPSMADSPPQRILALPSATPPRNDHRQSLASLRKAEHWSIAAPVAVSRALAVAESKTWMFCARVRAGRAWMACAACRASTRAPGTLCRAGPRSGPDLARSDCQLTGRGVGPNPDMALFPWSLQPPSNGRGTFFMPG